MRITWSGARRSRALLACVAFAVCFAVGMLGSLFFGLDSKTWVPAGLVTSTIVALHSFRGKRSA